MARGITPRRPGKTGLHEGARVSGAAGKKQASVVPTLSQRTRKNGAPSLAGQQQSKTTSRSYDPVASGRIGEILRRLDLQYPDVTCALTHRSAWELVVATILSAQSTDVRVNMVTPDLFKKYPSVQDFARIEPQQLEPDIRSTGFFRNKSANVVLGTWFGKAEGVVVDTHVHRIARRLELTKNDDPKKIEQDLMAIIPREKWILFSHQIIWHGRRLCIARSPKCVDCPLENICHAEDKTWSTVEKHKGAKV